MYCYTAEGKFSRELQLRLAKLQSRVTELAEKEQRVLQRQSAMAADLAAVRVTAETEYSRRVEIERALHESANIFKQQIWTKVGGCTSLIHLTHSLKARGFKP